MRSTSGAFRPFSSALIKTQICWGNWTKSFTARPRYGLYYKKYGIARPLVQWPVLKNGVRTFGQLEDRKRWRGRWMALPAFLGGRGTPPPPQSSPSVCLFGRQFTWEAARGMPDSCLLAWLPPPLLPPPFTPHPPWHLHTWQGMARRCPAWPANVTARRARNLPH